MVIAARDRLGVQRLFVDAAGTRWARDVASLLPASPTLDPDGVRFAWGLHADATRSCFAEVRPIPAGHALVGVDPLRHEPSPSPSPTGDLLGALVDAIMAIPGDAVLALSGGFDCAFVLALWRATGRPLPPVLSLRTPWPAYDERDAAAETARYFGLEPDYVDIGSEEVVAAIDAAIGAAETCLFNLHPIARQLLAREAVRRGHRVLVTGDGADQLFAGAPSEIFLPILGALVADAGIDLRSPFLDPDVACEAGVIATGSGKDELRVLARHLVGGEASFIERPKVPRWFPAIDLSARVDLAFVERVAGRFGLPGDIGSDRARVGWVTLQALARRFGVARCAD